ncbi:MAG: coproporphyrinogen dehydrogenase HemZ [Oscillospiraceae bacterium]|nr:coproporphyrinogen dehydrogenase HemZ [Oscillospiraceae bacterium]
MNLILDGHSYKYELESLANMFFHDQKVRVVAQKEMCEGECIYTRSASLPDGKVELQVATRMDGILREETFQGVPDEKDPERFCEYHLCRMLYTQLTEATGILLAWGMLTGVRPVRLIYRYRERGMDDAQIREHLNRDYFVSDEKIDLLLRTANKEKGILDLSRPESFSLYISIPFCPSRCNYCSFVSHSIERAKKLIPEYVTLLIREIQYVAPIVKGLGLRLETVYFGGGTPTAISSDQLEAIIRAIEENFDLSHLREYTVEAGRPDTITIQKLEMLKRRGVTRISINPQTMNDAVLEQIGRRHTTAQTIEAFEMARKAGHQNINMDLIAGLTGDSLESFCRTIDQVIGIGPENITLHTLSVKRSSRLGQHAKEFYLQEHQRVTDMLSYAGQRFQQEAYLPYYLYRQKNTMENLENVGYCKEGMEGYYNVYIMDETHSIIALGAGGVSKLRKPGGTLLHRIFNYKYPYEYIERFETVLQRKNEIARFYEEP